MGLFRIRGGVHPDQHKETQVEPIQKVPLPDRLFVPLQQHIGAPATPVVEVGQEVLKGELIAEAGGSISAAVHAPTSGRVIAIEPHTAPHPSGLPINTVVIEPDGEERRAEAAERVDPLDLTPAEIADRVARAGIVGMGGAAFPSAVKLNLGRERQIDTLIINGGECEPYLTCDDRLMQERPGEIIAGVLLMLRALGATRALIAVENNKPQAISALRNAAGSHPAIQVAAIPALYPMGSEKQMIQVLTGKEVPAGKLSADIGIVVHNVATAQAVHSAVIYSRPLLSRVVTVTGGAMARQANLEVLIGTRASHLVDFCGGFRDAPARLVLGGPMMGITVPHLDIPITKGTNGLLALARNEIQATQPAPCIRCGRCVSACPVGLLPLEMASRARAGDFSGAMDYGLADCIACGSCAYVCPASIPLTQYFNYAKGELAAQAEAKRKAEWTRKLSQERQGRLERQQKAKQEAAARRKAQRAAKQAAEQEQPA